MTFWRTYTFVNKEVRMKIALFSETVMLSGRRDSARRHILAHLYVRQRGSRRDESEGRFFRSAQVLQYACGRGDRDNLIPKTLQCPIT
jgi:hypothetical protein